MEAINGSVNELLPQLKLELVSDGDDNWSLRDSSGKTVPFRDGISIPTKADNPLAVAAERVRSPVAACAYTAGMGRRWGFLEVSGFNAQGGMRARVPSLVSWKPHTLQAAAPPNELEGDPRRAGGCACSGNATGQTAPQLSSLQQFNALTGEGGGSDLWVRLEAALPAGRWAEGRWAAGLWLWAGQWADQWAVVGWAVAV